MYRGGHTSSRGRPDWVIATSTRQQPARDIAVWVVHGIIGNSTERDENRGWWTSLVSSLGSPDSATYEYRPIFGRGSGVLRDALAGEARRLLREIDREIRASDVERVVLVGYDVGGTLIKQALRNAIREAPLLAQRVSLLVFFGTPHRARTRSLWREITYNLLSEAGIRIQENRRDVARALREVSKPLELIPGIFGVCNGSRGNYDIVGPYSASLGLPVTREFLFTWPADMNFPGRLRNELGRQILESSCPHPGYIDFLGRLLRFIREEAIAWSPPPEIGRFTWLTHDHTFISWLNSHGGILSLRGTSRGRLSDAAYYLARYMADRGRDTVVARFTLSRSSRQTSESEMLAGLIYQILCLRPLRFLDIEGDCRGLSEWPANRLRIILGLILASENGSGEDFVVVIDGVDGRWEGNDTPLAVLSEIQAFSPFKIIVTSGGRIEDVGGRQVLEIAVDDDEDSSASSRRSTQPSSSRRSMQLLAPVRRRGQGNSRSRQRPNGVSRAATFASEVSVVSEETSPLHAACKSGDTSAIRQALLDGADVQTTNNTGFTSLHVSCKYDHAEAVQELLQWHANVLARDREGYSPLHVACRSGSHRVIALLLTAMRECLPTDGRLRTPLHTAVYHGDVDTFRGILDHYLGYWGRSSAQASLLALEELLQTTDRDGRNALHAAAARGDVDIIDEVLIRAASRDNQSGVSRDSQPKILRLEQRLLLSRNLEGEYPLHLAARHGNTEAVKTLCQRSLDLDVVSARDHAGRTPLHLACSTGHLAVITELLGFHAMMDATDHDNVTPIIEAARAGFGDAVRLLFDQGASLLPMEGGSPLYEAVTAENEDLATAVLRMAANGRQRHDLRRQVDNKGRLPIMWAAQRGHQRLFETLLANDSQLSIKDANGNSVLHYAAEGGNHGIMSTMLGKRWLRSHVNAANCSGHTPLQWAARTGSVRVVDALLQHGARAVANTAISFAAIDEMGLRLLEASAGLVEAADLVATLHNAARRGHLRTTRIITSPDITIRPDPNCVDSDGKTALTLAAEAGQTEVVRYLAAHVDGMYINMRDTSNRTAISHAAEKGHTGVVEILASYGDVDLAEAGGSPLVYAALNGHLDIVRALKAAHIARYGRLSPISRLLCAAAEGGHADVVRFLLGKGADPNETHPPLTNSESPGSFNALEHALINGQTEIIGILARRVSPTRVPYLHLACSHPDGLREFLRHSPDVEAPDTNGTTALSFAVQNGRLESALLLLESGADPKRGDITGKTPLHHAAIISREKDHDRKQIVPGELLNLLTQYLRPQDSVSIQDCMGNTPLVEAIRAGAIYAVRALLVRERTSIAFPTSEGRLSPLWVALETNHGETARLILELADLRVLTGSHHDLVVVAAKRDPDMQLALIKNLPSLHVRLGWVQDLAKNDTTGQIVDYLLREGAETGRVDDHGWTLTDFAYATDPRRSWTKRDEEITRTANQVYGRPGRWLPVGEDGYLQIFGGGVMARYIVPYGIPSTHVAVRADHPIPPHRAYYFEIRILNAGLDARFVAIGLCTADTTIPDLRPSALGRYPSQSLRYLYHGGGLVEKSGQVFAQGDGFATGDIIGCHMDLARGMAYFRKNGTRIGLRQRPNEMLPVSGRLFPVVVMASSGCEVVAGFDQAPTGAYYDREELREDSDSET